MKTYLATAMCLPVRPGQILDVYIVAGRKADIGPLLEDRRVNPQLAADIARSARLTPGTSDLDALRDIGLANQVGVYLVSEDRPVSEVFELKFDGTARLIATIVFNSWRRTAIPSDTKEAHR